MHTIIVYVTDRSLGAADVPEDMAVEVRDYRWVSTKGSDSTGARRRDNDGEVYVEHVFEGGRS